jgi:hypothetical protein
MVVFHEEINIIADFPPLPLRLSQLYVWTLFLKYLAEPAGLLPS